MQEETNKAVYNAALAMLARREYSTAELKDKLLKKFPSDTPSIDSATEKLLEQRYLCDERYAEAYIRARSRKGFGNVRIQQELRQKGVDSSVVEKALECSEVDWSALAEGVLLKKYKHIAEEYSEKAKQQGFLRYRGFDSEVIQVCFNSDDM